MATGFGLWYELANVNEANNVPVIVRYKPALSNDYYILTTGTGAATLTAGTTNKWNQLSSFNREPNQVFPITSVQPATFTITSPIHSDVPSNFSAIPGDKLTIYKRAYYWSGNIDSAQEYIILEPQSNPSGPFSILPVNINGAGYINGVLGASNETSTFWGAPISVYGYSCNEFSYSLVRDGFPEVLLYAYGPYYNDFANVPFPFASNYFSIRYNLGLNYGTPSNLPNYPLTWDLYATSKQQYEGSWSGYNLAKTWEPWYRFVAAGYRKKIATFTMIPAGALSLNFTPKIGPAGTLITVTSNYDLINASKVGFVKDATSAGMSNNDVPLNVINRKTFTFTNIETNYSYRPVVRFDTEFQSYVFPDNNKTNVFLKPPIIYEFEGSNFSGWSGKIGELVHIYGSNFKYLNSVKINGVTANFQLSTLNIGTIYPEYGRERITITVPQGVSSGPIELTNDAGSVTSQNNFYIQPAPTITSFTPASGLSGSEVVITGTNFFGAFPDSGSAVLSVKFSGNYNATILEVTNTTIKVYAPNPATGAIQVITSGGTATSESIFTQTYPPSGTLKRIGLNQEILDVTGNVYTGYQYYISGGSLDTLISVKFKYTNNSTLYDAVFEKISANTAKVTIPFMNNTTNGGTIEMVLQNAYATSSNGSYQLAINHANINYPTISTYQTTPNNNTTPVTTKIGTNAYFNNANAWEKTTDIYFAKPTTRKDGLTENSEWTKAVAGWFSNNGEWQQFWPSVENAAKKFYKFDWESAGITGLIDVIKVVPDYPNLYLLLANSPGVVAYGSNVEPNSKSIIAKVNMLNGTISFIDVKGARGTNSCHISDIHVSSDSVYAVGYDYTNNFVPESYGWNNIYNDHYMFEPHVRYLRSVGDIVIPGSVSVGDDQLGHFFLRKFKGYSSEIVLDAIVKKYNKNLNLQFSRKISTTLGAIRSYNDILANLGKNHFQAFKSLSIDVATYPFGGSNYFYLQDNGLHEPKITLFNGALYIIFPIVSCDGPTETTSFYSAFPTKVSFVAKKLKPTNLTEYTGETQVRLISANSKPLANVAADLTYESVAQFEFFRGWPTNKKSGFTQYSVFADQQLNGNNKISFNDGFYWNSLQINPDIRNAFLARDGVFNYATIIGDLESGTSDDNKNGMFVGLYAKNDTFEIMCGTESESGKVATTTDVQFSNINSFLENYSSLQPVYTATSFPTSAFTVTETLSDNGGTGFPMTQVCNA